MRSSTWLLCSSRLRSPNSWRVVLFAALILPTAVVPARIYAHQTAQKGSSKLGSVQIIGSQRFHSDQIAKVLPFHAGDNVSREDLQSGADKLAALGTFATVQYRFTSEDAGGVKVEYQVTDAPTVPVTFDNFPLFTDEELATAMKEAVVLFDGSAPKGGAILDAMSSALEKLIQTRGLHAPVSHHLIETPSATQLFRIESPALKVSEVRFSDELAQKDPGVQERLPDVIGKPFSRGTFQLFEFEQVRPVYLAHAFLRVKFGTPEARFVGNPNRPLPDNVVVLAPITRGPAYAWHGVTWSGNRAIDSETLDKLAELKPGETADGTKVELQWQRVRDLYARRGYLDLSLDPVPEFDDAALRVKYKVSISEGPQYHMGKLVLTGLSLEAERRIRAAWNMPADAIFDEPAYQEFLESGVKKAFFGLPVHYEKIGRFLDKDPSEAKVDVLLDFQ
jgi:outer membrane protein assembly factor BamA